MDASDSPLSGLDAALRRRQRIVTAELTSPVGANAASLRRRARLLRGHVIAANVPDGQAGGVHMSPTAAARLLLDEGLEPVLTVQCRDRNRLALQAELIGAAALGVRNVLCTTGDMFGPGSDAQPVFDLDGVGLLQAASVLGNGRLLDGSRFHDPPRLVLGAVAQPFAPTHAERIDRLQLKADAGARFLQTQYLFDVAGFSSWLAEARSRGLHERLAILAAVGPVRSPRVLEFLRRLPGVVIPRELDLRLAGRSGAEFEAESVRICAESARALSSLPGVAGIHLIAPYWEERIPEILAAAGLTG